MMVALTTESAKTPEPKKASEPAKPPAGSKPADLAPASESGNQAVHQLLAERQTAVLNDDQDAIAAIDKTLREEHGVSAG